jgi:hypothetical protein
MRNTQKEEVIHAYNEMGKSLSRGGKHLDGDQIIFINQKAKEIIQLLNMEEHDYGIQELADEDKDHVV